MLKTSRHNKMLLQQITSPGSGIRHLCVTGSCFYKDYGIESGKKLQRVSFLPFRALEQLSTLWCRGDVRGQLQEEDSGPSSHQASKATPEKCKKQKPTLTPCLLR